MTDQKREELFNYLWENPPRDLVVVDNVDQYAENIEEYIEMLIADGGHMFNEYFQTDDLI